VYVKIERQKARREERSGIFSSEKLFEEKAQITIFNSIIKNLLTIMVRKYI